MVDNVMKWESRGKTIEGLIKELESFEDRSLEVEFTMDGGVTTHPISLVGKLNGKCLLFNIKVVEQ